MRQPQDHIRRYKSGEVIHVVLFFLSIGFPFYHIGFWVFRRKVLMRQHQVIGKVYHEPKKGLVSGELKMDSTSRGSVMNRLVQMDV